MLRDTILGWKALYGIVVIRFILIILSFSIALFLAELVRYDLQSHSQERFEGRIDQIMFATNTYYEGISIMLRSIQVFFASTDFVSRDEFYDFIKTSGMRTSYPSISTFIYVRRVLDAEKESFLEEVQNDHSIREEGYPEFSIIPPGDRDEYWPITYVDPESTAQSLLGIDQYAEEKRRKNIENIRDTGNLSVSLVDTLLPKGDSGFIVAAPLYTKHPNTLKERREFFSGAVTMAFYGNDFFENMISKNIFDRSQMELSVFDVSENGMITKNAFLEYKGANKRGLLADLLFPSLSSEKIFFFEGKTLMLRFSAPAGAELDNSEILEPIIIFITFFVLVTTILLGFFFVQRNKSFSQLKERYDFITILSHQLRTPLAGIKWAVELLNEEKTLKKNEEFHDIQEKLESMSKIVNKLLLFVEMPGKLLLDNIQKVSAEDLLEKALMEISGERDQKRILIKNAVRKEKTISVDEKKLALALSYVLSNALIYSSQEKNVLVTMSAQEKYLEISVQDTGIGIPLSEQKMIFREFFRATNASLGINYGSGVSLNIVQKIIEAHHGTISFISEEGVGTTFRIRIPFVK